MRRPAEENHIEKEDLIEYEDTSIGEGEVIVTPFNPNDIEIETPPFTVGYQNVFQYIFQPLIRIDFVFFTHRENRINRDKLFELLYGSLQKDSFFYPEPEA